MKTVRKTSLPDALAELWRFRSLLRQLVVRELKIRYKNSAFGFLWSIVPPLLQVLVYTFVFKGILRIKADNYSAYLLCGLIPWTFFSTAILDSGQTLLLNYQIIKKIYLPREVFPLASVLSNGVHFLMGWVVYFVFFFLIQRLRGQGLPFLPSLVMFPVITFFLFLLVAGLSLWISILNHFYLDVKYIVQTLFQLLFFLLPILYPADNFYHSHYVKQYPWLYTLYMLNPITALINAYRKTILEPVPLESFNLQGKPLPMDWGLFAASCFLCLVIFWGGYAYFQYRRHDIVERW